MISLTGKPSSAVWMLEASSLSYDSVPNFDRNISQPSTQPGTDHDSGPVSGISSSIFWANTSRFSVYGLRPLAFRPYSFLVLASQ